MLNALIGINRALTRRRPHLAHQPALLPEVHSRALAASCARSFVGGAFTEPATLQFFYDLGIPVGNGYGCTEAGTAITLNDFKPFRADTVGKPLPGMEMRIVNPDAEGIGEVAVRSKTVMSHYLDDPGNDGGNDRGRLADDRRPRPRGRDRPFAALRPQEKHDRHRGRQEYLSRGHRERLSKGCR